MFRQEEKSRGLIYYMFNFPQKEFVTLIIDAWGHHNGARSSADKFDMRATVKKFFLTPPPPLPPRHLHPGAQATPSPRATPSNKSWGRAFGLEAGGPLRGNVKK